MLRKLRVTICVTFTVHALVSKVVLSENRRSALFTKPPLGESWNLTSMVYCGSLSVHPKYKGLKVNANNGKCYRIRNEDTEFLMPSGLKTRNTFFFSPQLVIDTSLGEGYSTEIPGGTITNLQADIGMEPKNPWNTITVHLEDESGQTAPLRVLLRNDLQSVRINYRVNGRSLNIANVPLPSGFPFQANEAFKLTIVVMDQNFEVKHNGNVLHTYDHRIDKSIATQLRINVDGTALLQEIDFKIPE